MKYAFLFIMLLTATSSLRASEAQGKIDVLRAANDSYIVLFSLAGETEDPIRCNEWKMYAINLLKPGGRAVFELLRLAKEKEYTVKVYGLGHCSAHWKSEDIKDIEVK